VFCRWTISFNITVVERKNALSLLRTCRQIYFEARLLPYSISTISTLSTKVLVQWLLKRSAAQCSAISTVELRFTFNAPDRLQPDKRVAAISLGGATVVAFLLEKLTGLKKIILLGSAGERHEGNELALDEIRKRLAEHSSGIEVTAQYAVLRPNGTLRHIWRQNEGRNA